MKKSYLKIVSVYCFIAACVFSTNLAAQGNKPRIIQIDTTVNGSERGSVLFWRNSQPGDSIRKFLHLQIHELRCKQTLNSPESTESYALYLRASSSNQWLRAYNFNTDCQTDGVTAWAFLPIVNGDDEFWFTDQQVEAEVRVEGDDGNVSSDAVMRGVDVLF